jgi:hypothetical protein
MSSTMSANHGPCSAVPISRGTGRCLAAISGSRSADAALTKNRLPSAQRTRAATPGLKPPGWVRASITEEPQARSIAIRAGCGTSCQATLVLSAVGALTPAVCGRRAFCRNQVSGVFEKISLCYMLNYLLCAGIL